MSEYIEKGQVAPEITLPNQDGQDVELKHYLGSWVVLFFYPKDLTPGCTVEACDFSDSYRELTQIGVQVFGISKDTVKKHKDFWNKYSFPYDLLSDQEGDVCERYGVWQEKSMFGKRYFGIARTTYIIDPKGDVARVFSDVKVTGHVSEVKKAVIELQG